MNYIYCILLGLTVLTACDWRRDWLASPSELYAPADKKILIVANAAEPDTLDPQKASGVPESLILRALFEGLTQTDAAGKTIPAVAVRWQSRDHKKWLFYLRHNARWSNGAKVTAFDFVYAWQRLVAPQTASVYASYLADVYVKNAALITAGKKPPAALGVKALDAYTLEVNLDRPVPFFPDILSHSSLYPVYAPNIAGYGEKWTRAGNMVSNGAYVLSSWYVNNRIKLVKNPYYWDASRTAIAAADFLPIQSIPDVVNFAAGGEDLSNNILPQELFAKLKRDYPRELKVFPLACNYYYEINVSRAPLNDKRVRLALNLLLDRDRITQDVMNMGQIAAYGLVPSFLKDAPVSRPPWAELPRSVKITAALRLLRQAGYNSRRPLKLQMLTNTVPKHKTIALAMMAQWQQVAPFIQVTLVNKEWKSFLASQVAGDFDLARKGWCADFNNPVTFLNLYKSNSSNNYIGYSNPEFDRVLDSLFSKEHSSAAVKQIYARAQDILTADVVNLPLFYEVGTRLVKPYVRGYSDKDPFDALNIKNLRLQYAP